MTKKGKKPIYRTSGASKAHKHTIDLDKISDTSLTSTESQPNIYKYDEYKDLIDVSPEYKGVKSKTKQKSIISLKNITILFTSILTIGGIIWYFAGLDADVNYIKDELKTVKKKTEKLSESSVSQEVKITNIDNNLREMHSEIRELNNKIFENSRNNN